MLNINAIGYVGNDATIKEVNGKKVTNFSIAHSEKYKNATGTLVEKTTWLECSMWDAENLTPHLKKGTMVFVTGTPECNAWITKNGDAASNLRCRVVKLELLTGKKENPQQASTGTTVENAEKKEVQDDLPF